MEYTFTESGGTARAALRGSVTFKDVSKYPEIIGRFSGAVAKTWEFDLGGVDFLDSSGMSLFVLAHDAARAKGAALSLRNASGRVLDGLKRARFDQLMPVA